MIEERIDWSVSASQIAWTWRADQVFVGQVEPRRDDRAGDHVARAAEPVAVVGVAGGAVGQDQRLLAAATGAAGALGVVGRGRRDVAQRRPR